MEQIVQRAVLMLPPMQREVLILVLSRWRWRKMPILQIDVGAVKSRLQRAWASLRELLAAYAPNVEQKP